MNYPLTLELPENVYESLVKKAKQAGKSPEVLAVQLLTTATQTLIDDPLEPFIGAFSSMALTGQIPTTNTLGCLQKKRCIVRNMKV